MELEGLRGIASVIVVLTHLVFLFYPAMRQGDMSLTHTSFEDNIYGTPLMLAVAGTLAVAIFFVLSGFVLSIGFFKTGDQNIVKKLATSRYLRLMLPALASVLIAWLLINFGAHSLTAAAGEIANSKSLSMKWANTPTFFEALKTGTLDIFVEFKGESRSINHVLWTMNVEFIGSFLVFAFLLLFSQSKLRWLAYLALVVGTFGTWYLAFIVGVMIADAHHLGWLEKLRHWYVTAPMAIIAVFLGIFPKNHRGTLYEVLDLSFFNVSERIVYMTLSATLIMLVVLLSEPVSRLLRMRFLSTLGKYTFSLYLMHLIVIYTVTTSVVILTHERLGYNWSVLLAFLVSVPAFWIVSYLFERYIDAPSIRFARYVSSLYRGEKPTEWWNHTSARYTASLSLFRRTQRRETIHTSETSEPSAATETTAKVADRN